MDIFFKVAGSLLIIVSSTLFGVCLGNMDKLAIYDLREMKKAFTILKAEISFAQSNIYEAMNSIAKRIEHPVADIFSAVADGIQTDFGESFYTIWQKAVLTNKCHFTEDDLDAFLSFGKTLGYLDKDMQTTSIKLAIDYIDERISDLTISDKKNAKLYRSLGLLFGTLAAVIII